jgi:hypothetical protein
MVIAAAMVAASTVAATAVATGEGHRWKKGEE